MSDQTPDAVAQARAAVLKQFRVSTAAPWEDVAKVDALIAAVRAECAAKANEVEPCDWHQDGMGLWQTDCGNAFEFNEDGPWMNGLKFCGYCGKKLVEVPYEPMPDDDEEAQP